MKRFLAIVLVFLVMFPTTGLAVEIVRTVDIPYPLVDRLQGNEGTGLFEIQVDTGEVKVVQSTGHRRLDEAVLWAVRQWSFETSASTIILPVSFQLED